MAAGDGQMDLWSLFIFVIFVGSIPLATAMARERGRSRRFWFWIAFIVGPLAPAVLLVLGDRRDGEPNHA
jgi:peptidoglycan/LPS O-acetylase OafA/YrhL